MDDIRVCERSVLRRGGYQIDRSRPAARSEGRARVDQKRSGCECRARRRLDAAAVGRESRRLRKSFPPYWPRAPRSTSADENGETPLLLACGNGNLAMARMLLDAKADVNAASVERRYSSVDGGQRRQSGADQAAARSRRARGRRGTTHGPDSADVGRGRGPPTHGHSIDRAWRQRECGLAERIQSPAVRGAARRCGQRQSSARRQGRPSVQGPGRQQRVSAGDGARQRAFGEIDD